jgi:hypothetical protein
MFIKAEIKLCATRPSQRSYKVADPGIRNGGLVRASLRILAALCELFIEVLPSPVVYEMVG